MKHFELDNPVWYSLSQTQNLYDIGIEGAKFYKPEYCVFGAFEEINSTKNALDKYSEHANAFYIVGNRPNFNKNIELKLELVCNQMLLETLPPIEIRNEIIELKSPESKNDLFELVNWVQPGYFRHKTHEMGKYFGIYENNTLVAAAGERMKMNNYTEISSVVTHPNYTRRFFAQDLMIYLCNLIVSENKNAFLHVAEGNTIAMNLYHKMGFSIRRKMSFWHLSNQK